MGGQNIGKNLLFDGIPHFGIFGSLNADIKSLCAEGGLCPCLCNGRGSREGQIGDLLQVIDTHHNIFFWYTLSIRQSRSVACKDLLCNRPHFEDGSVGAVLLNNCWGLSTTEGLSNACATRLRLLLDSRIRG